MRITNKGGILAFDIIFSLSIFLLIIFLSIWQTAEIAENAAKNRKLTEEETFAFFAADTIVKNSDNEEWRGFAFFDIEQHRVKSNEIETGKIIGLEKNERIFEAWLRDGSTVKKIFSKNHESKNCYAIERLVLANGKKALLGVKVCE